MRAFFIRAALPLAAMPGLAAMPAVAATCIVPAKPGGGMDLTCRLAQSAMEKNSPAGKAGLQIDYLPGGVGAVAWSSLVSQRRAEPDTLVAFSGGSLLNLAQGKFGRASSGDVRWVAALGADYGMVAVRKDSPYKNLRELIDGIRRHPSKVLIGMSGTIGSQDWLKMALLVRQAGIDPKVLRFVALEGGGESFTALQADYVQVVSGDTSEAAQYATGGRMRVLAVLADARLPGPLADVPTAREQGFDVSWPIIRGLYMGPKVSDAQYRKWVSTFERAMATPEFARQRAALGLYPFAMTGSTLTEYIDKGVESYRRQAGEMGLLR